MDIIKLGVGITKMKKVTRGAVVIECENRGQAEKLKEEIKKNLGEKYSMYSTITDEEETNDKNIC